MDDLLTFLLQSVGIIRSLTKGGECRLAWSGRCVNMYRQQICQEYIRNNTYRCSMQRVQFLIIMSVNVQIAERMGRGT